MQAVSFSANFRAVSLIRRFTTRPLSIRLKDALTVNNETEVDKHEDHSFDDHSDAFYCAESVKKNYEKAPNSRTGRRRNAEYVFISSLSLFGTGYINKDISRLLFYLTRRHRWR